MYNASADFIDAAKRNARREHVRGTIGAVSFTDENVISLTYSNRCSDTADVSFGSAYVGQIKATFKNVNIPRGSWRNLAVSLQFGIEIDDETTEYIPVGEFYIASATWNDQGISIIANDVMSKLDRAMTADTMAGDPYQILQWTASACGINLGQTQADVEALPNGTEVIGLYAENNVTTYRDMISSLAAFLGGYATADREGNLVIRSWSDSEVVDTLAYNKRTFGSSFSDYETLYDGITVTDTSDGLEHFYGRTGNGAIIKLGENPFMQYGIDTVKSRQRNAVATVAQGINWTPFRASILSNLIYDLGDLITMTGGVAGTSLTCCVMGIEWSSKQTTTLQGYGADPSVASGKSKTDKALKGVASKSETNKVKTLTFTNVEQISFTNDWTEIGKIRFAVTEDQPVQIHGVAKTDLATDGTVWLRYKVNSEVQPTANAPFIHVIQFPEGEDTVTFFFPVEVLGGQFNDVTVEIMSDTTGTIDVQDVWMSIMATGINEAAWEGLIEVSDEYLFPIGEGIGFSYEDTAPTITLLTPIAISTLSDEFDFPLGTGLIFEYEDSCSIILERGVYDVASADYEYQIGSSDSEYILQSSK